VSRDSRHVVFLICASRDLCLALTSAPERFAITNEFSLNIINISMYVPVQSNGGYLSCLFEFTILF
jgi:hypothetical protein